MPVHALEQHGYTIDEYLLVLDFNFPESGAAGAHLANLTLRIEHLNNNRVQVRRFRRPFQRRLDHLVDFNRRVFTGRNLNEIRLAEYRACARGIHQRGPDAATRRTFVHVFEADGHAEIGIPVGVIQIGQHEQVADANPGRIEKIDIPEDTAQPPEILVLQIRTVAPAVDFHRQNVFAGS